MQNLVDILGEMPYPGRGIIAGRNSFGDNVVAYFLTGRSDPSKKREFLVGDNTGVISTHVTDPAQLAKGSSALLIYPAVAPCEKIINGSNKHGLIVTNGGSY
ncbi:MAG: IMP cyclohydrolase [Nanoarchaeota archaeon]